MLVLMLVMHKNDATTPITDSNIYAAVNSWITSRATALAT